jgi:hypothetical protein
VKGNPLEYGQMKLGLMILVIQSLCCGQRDESEPTPRQVLYELSQIERFYPFDAEGLEGPIGVGLTPECEGCEHHIVARPRGPFLGASFTPTGRGGRVSVRIPEQPCLPPREVREHFGDIEPIYPSPHNPEPETTSWWTKTRPWGRYRFGFDRESMCLAIAVLEGT